MKDSRGSKAALTDVERVENMGGGGILATVVITAVTYASGWLPAITGKLGDAWSHVTPGQAALAIGLLTYATHNLPKLARWCGALLRRKGSDAT